MPRFREVEDKKEKEFEEAVVEVSRVSRVVKGGRRIRFRAAVVVGNRAGLLGAGVGKANDVQGAVEKAKRKAKKNLFKVPIIENTIPHRVEAEYKAAKIVLIPAREGTGVIAGGVIRTMADLAGIKNMLSKSIGSKNKISNQKAMIRALKSFKTESD